MPFLLRRKENGEIFACTLVNVYQIPYYGAKFWEDEEQAYEEYSAWLVERNEDPDAWEITQAEERQIKLFNVKLNNNPSRKIFLNAQEIKIESRLL